jgi:GT2 family glycosyltransferase
VIDISVVIPTYNRRSSLLHCLRGLDEQTLDRARYEIIVIDDASTDETPAALRAKLVRSYRQSRNAGPAAARNVGIRAAAGTYVLFLDDDVVAGPALLQQHLEAHRRAADNSIAVLGGASNGVLEDATPLERYLSVGWSAYYARLSATDPENVPYTFFYTFNASLKRNFLLRHGLFDEDFPYAYGEDTELAYRLQRQGLRIVFRPEIVVDHKHRWSYRRARRHRRQAGEVGLVLALKHPEFAELDFLRLGLKARLADWVKRRATEITLDPFLDLADRRRWDNALLARCFLWALGKHRWWGLLDAVDARGQRPLSPRALPSAGPALRNTAAPRARVIERATVDESEV